MLRFRPGGEEGVEMRALIWHGPRSMTLENVPEPAPAPEEVVIRVDAVGICGSELSGYLGENSLRVPPLIMGHEFTGRVVQAPPASRLAPGQAVVVNPLLSCGECPMCRSGLDNLCAKRSVVGAHRPGAFAELISVPERSCHPLPPEVDPVLGAMVEPLACGVRAMELGQIGLGEGVFILGAGTIGLFALALARRAGAGLLAVADVNRSRLETARAWGATHVLDARSDVVGEIQRLTAGSGVDLAIDAVGLTATRRAAVHAVRRGGRVVLLGLHEGESSFPANDMVRGEVQVTGSFAYRSRSFERALALVQSGVLSVAGRSFEVRRLAQGPEPFEQLVAGELGVAKLVLRP